MRRAMLKERLSPGAPIHGLGRSFPVAHVFGLWAFAVAQPVLDLIGREPGFLVAHRLTGVLLAALALGLAIGVPAVLAAPLAFPAALRRRAGRLWMDVTRALLAGAFLLQLTHRLPSAVGLGLAAVGGAGTVFCLRRYRAFSSFLAVTAAAAVAVPLVFLLRPNVRDLLLTGPASAAEAPEAGASRRMPTGTSAHPVSAAHPPTEPIVQVAAAPGIRSDTPIVFVVFDELATSSIQLPDGSIDARRYPSFAALAASADWYPRAVTTATQTARAIPTLLTGNLPRSDANAHYRDYPANLFSWLSQGGYRIVAYEAFSLLCPPAVCTEQPLASPWERLGAAADDLGVVYGHLLLPPTLRTGLPEVNQTWTGFRGGGRSSERAEDTGGRGLHQDVPRVVDSFLSRMEGNRNRGPTLYYLHLNLPHVPFRYLPSGREYVPAGAPVIPPGLDDPEVAEEEWLYTQGLQRYLLQVGYTDRVLGRIVDRLRGIDLYDRALIVVTADHGFRAGALRRAVTEANFEELMEVPLFVKRPGQREGRIVNHVVQTIDIVPTIGEALAAQPPWEVDGTVLSDTSPRKLTVCCYAPPTPSTLSFRTDPVRRQSTLDRLHGLFGNEAVGNGSPPLAAADPFDGVFAAGPRPDLLGRPAVDLIRELPDGDSSRSVRAILKAPRSYEDVRPQSGFVPSLIGGRIEPAVADGTKLAVTVDGIVRATTETFSHGGAGRFSALVHERWLAAGSRRIGIYAIEDVGGETVLQPLPIADR